MPAILRTLKRITRLFEDNRIDYMIIGGYALPFYGRLRTTVDLDLAVAVQGQMEFDSLLKVLVAGGFQPTVCSPLNPLVLVLDCREHLEVEIWIRPDGIEFDEETLRRRKRVSLSEGVSAWIVSAEDFVVSKLARPDRGVSDEQDVQSVLVRQAENLDWRYLEERARAAGVQLILNAIRGSKQ